MTKSFSYAVKLNFGTYQMGYFAQKVWYFQEIKRLIYLGPVVFTLRIMLPVPMPIPPEHLMANLKT